MADNELKEFNIEEQGFSGTLGLFSNDCVDDIKVSAVTQSEDESWTATEMPGWISTDVGDTELTMTVDPIEEGDGNLRECVLSAITLDEDEKTIANGSCGYLIKIIQQRSVYVVPGDDTMDGRGTFPTYSCNISGTTGGEEEGGKYRVPHTGGNVSLGVKITKQ